MTRARRSAAFVALALALTALSTATQAPSQATTRGSARDAVTAEGYDYSTLHTADVIAGSAGNNLVLRYTAGRALHDGVVRVVVPTRSWPTSLHPEEALYLSAAPGGFSVRPGITADGSVLPEPTRASSEMCDPVGPDSWDVRTISGAQVITVRGVSCDAGRELDIRLEGIRAPASPGGYLFPVVATSGLRDLRLSIARVQVVPLPRTRLVVSAPAHVAPGVPFDLTVSAVGPDGRPDPRYRGAVALVSEDAEDCTLVPEERTVAHQFTAADRGTATIRVRLDTVLAHRLRVYDVGHRALDGVTAPFEVSGPPPTSISCPVSFH